MDFHQLLAKMQELDQPVPESQVAEEPTEGIDVDECGMEPGPMDMQKPEGQPPSMSVNINAQGMDDIAELMQLLTKVNPDMQKPAGNMPAPALPPLKMLPLDLDDKGMDLDLDDKGMDADTDRINQDPEQEPKKEKEEAYENEPEEQYKDVDYMVNKLAGGMNRPKDTFPKVADGDNPMNFRESIRQELLSRLEEAKAKLSKG